MDEPVRLAGAEYGENQGPTMTGCWNVWPDGELNGMGGGQGGEKGEEEKEEGEKREGRTRGD